MQIKTETHKFNPITITLETEEEARAFFMVAGWAGTTYDKIEPLSGDIKLTKGQFTAVFGGKLFDALKKALGD